MITVGKNNIEAFSIYDWTALVNYVNRHTAIPTPALRALMFRDPSRVLPEDLADDLDDLLDTNPSKDIRDIITGTLHRLQQQGVRLAKRS